MRIAIDITEALNGWRLDILEEGQKPRKENCITRDELFKCLEGYAKAKRIQSPPITTMEVL